MNTTTPITQDATDPRVFSAVMSKELADRDGEVVLLDGIDFTNFKSNPVMMFEHGKDGKAGKIPVGKIIHAEKNGDSYEIKGRFADRPENHPVNAEWIPDTLCSLMAQKCLNAVSMGFMPKESRKANMNDRNKYGSGTKMVTTKSEMLELSVTGLPVNQGSLVTAIGKSLVPKESEVYLDRKKVKIQVEVRRKHKVLVEVDRSARIEQVVTARVLGLLYA